MASTAPARVEGGRGLAAPALLRERIEAWLETERDQLPLFAPVLLGCGIAAWFLLPGPADWLAFGAAALAVAAAGIAVEGRLGRMLIAGGLLMALGIGIAWQRAEQVAAPRLADERVAVSFTAEVLRLEDRSGREQWRLYLKPADASLPPKVRVSLRKPPPEGIKAGATIRLRATLRPPPGPSIPGGYDYSRRAWFEGIGAVGFALGPPELLAPAKPPDGVRAWLGRVRSDLTGWIADTVGGREGTVAAALVTGDQGPIPLDLADAMRASGLAHLLSISGVHIAVVIGFTMVAARRLLTLSPWIALHWPVKTVAAALAAVAGILYTLLAGAEVPTVRSCAAAIVVLIGLVLGRRAFSLRTVAAGAFFILLLWPEALLGPSFQLSFAAVTGIIAASEAPAFRRWLQPTDEAPGWGQRLWTAVMALLITGIVAQAMLAPVAFFHFNRDGIYGVLANLIAIPLTSFVIMPALGLLLALGSLGLEGPAAWAVRESMALLLWIAETVAGWPGAVARLPAAPTATYALFVAGGLWLALWRTRVRLAGFAPIALGVALALTARPPDLVVSPNGMHVGVATSDGRLAMLRPRAGDFIRSMWGDAAGTAATLPFDDLPNASCSDDACLLRLTRGGRDWRLLATRSRAWLPRETMEPHCAAADIVISDRRLPDWCVPRWLKLDRPALERTGAVSIRLSTRPEVATAAAAQGVHPWAVAPRLGAGGRGG